MIDYVKVSLPSTYWKLLSENQNLIWNKTHDDTTGELIKAEAKYGSITFTYIKPKYSSDKNSRGIQLKFSFGTIIGQGKNYRDPYLYEVEQIIKYFGETFSIQRKDATINFIEFGCTFISQFNYKSIDQNIISYKGNPMNKVIEFGQRIGWVGQQTQSSIKIYGKHLKYPELKMPESCRIEVKVWKMENLKLKEKLTFSNLLNDATITVLREKLSNSIDQIIFNEQIEGRTKPEKRLLKDWANPIYINNLKTDKPSSYKKERVRYIKLQPKDSKWQKVKEECLAHWDRIVSEKGTNLTINSECAISEKGTNLTYIIGQAIPDKCIITGLDISKQKQGSKFLSTKSIEILKKSSPEVFETLLQRFRPKNLGKPEKEIFKDIAHNIRNSDSNIRAIKKEKEAKLEIKKSRSIRFYKNSLFPMTM